MRLGSMALQNQKFVFTRVAPRFHMPGLQLQGMRFAWRHPKQFRCNVTWSSLHPIHLAQCNRPGPIASSKGRLRRGLWNFGAIFPKTWASFTIRGSWRADPDFFCFLFFCIRGRQKIYWHQQRARVPKCDFYMKPLRRSRAAPVSALTQKAEVCRQATYDDMRGWLSETAREVTDCIRLVRLTCEFQGKLHASSLVAWRNLWAPAWSFFFAVTRAACLAAVSRWRIVFGSLHPGAQRPATETHLRLVVQFGKSTSTPAGEPNGRAEGEESICIENAFRRRKKQSIFQMDS